jgi:competence protein ComFC
MPTLALRNPFHGLVSLFYPAACAVCCRPIELGENLCPDCAAKALRISAPFCARCSEPFFGQIIGPFQCANCEGRTLHFDAAVSAYRSRNVVRKVIHDFKYGRQIHLRRVVGQWLLQAWSDPRLARGKFHLIVPVPLHPARKRERGFNQAELLGLELQRASGIRCRSLLQRIRYTTTQTQFDRSERMENLRGAFRLRPRSHVRGLRMLLVDDVLTTGSTLSECASVLKAAGAVSVYAVTAARG